MIKKVIKNKKQKITIDKLAQMTANSFLQIDEKFEKVDERFNEIDKRFEKVEERLEKIEDSMVDLRITMDRRLNSMEEKIEKGIDKMYTLADDMTKKFSHWNEENAFSAGIETRQNEELEDHEVRIVKIEQKLEV